MTSRQAAALKGNAQGHAFRLRFAAAEQALLKAIKMGKLVVGAQRRMIRDVIGHPDKFVKGMDDGAVPPPDDPGRYREILVVMALAGTQLCTVDHWRLGALT
jgi:hypothetical protein